MFAREGTPASEAGPTTPRQRRHERTRDEIIEAAWHLCRTNGLAALSLRDLAGHVGMRASSLYSYVPSKDAIFDAMFAQGQRELAEHLAFLPTTDVTRADIRAGTHAFFDFCTADPVRYQLMFQRVVPGFVPSPESYALAVANLDRMAAQLVAAGIDDSAHLDLWTAVLTGLTSQQITNDPGGDRWRRLLDQTIDLLCDHAGLPREASE